LTRRSDCESFHKDILMSLKRMSSIQSIETGAFGNERGGDCAACPSVRQASSPNVFVWLVYGER
jgi:hypothetical protein